MIIQIPEIDELERQFTYIFEDSEYHNKLIYHFKNYIVDNEKWAKVANDAARKRARNHLLEIGKLTKMRRDEIMDEYWELEKNEQQS
jgi:hypothetical protein